MQYGTKHCQSEYASLHQWVTCGWLERCLTFGAWAPRKQAPPHLRTQAEELALLQQSQREILRSVRSMNMGMLPNTERKVQHQAPEAGNSARAI